MVLYSMVTKTSKAKTALKSFGATALMSAGAIGQMTVMQAVSADEATQVTAGSFDLTKQADKATFPVMFDRPSGVNAAALAGTVINLGTDSKLYQSAVKAVPELADQNKMANLLSNSLSTDATAKAEARTTIVKLINWYNGLGGNPIKTQGGATYTAANLDEPINTLAVAFSDNKSINSRVSDTVTKAFANAKTVKDVMAIFDGYANGTSSEYQSAFNAYAAKVYAKGANIDELSKYENVKGVLDAYENMYAKGASVIRKDLLNGSSSTEAGVTFFESAIVTGRLDNSDGGKSDSNKPVVEQVKTRWITDNGTELAPTEQGSSYKGEKSFPGYTLKEATTKDGTKTYIYTKNPDKQPEKKVTEVTKWVDKNGNPLKPQENGTKPDNDGTSDIPGYRVVSYNTTTDKDGNKTTVNVYEKEPEKKVVTTYWFDKDGNSLKDKAQGTFPDTDGVSDIPGYKVVSVHTVTADDLKSGDFKGSDFKEGDTINIYEKEPEKKQPTEVTKWVDKTGKELKPQEKGTKPDDDGKTDIPDYVNISHETTTDADGNKVTVNVYEPAKKQPTEVTKWVDKSGKELKPQEKGTKPDNDGKSDIPNYVNISHETTTDENGNKTTINVYEPAKQVTEVTKWVDKSGKELKPQEKATKPDDDGKSDIPGYVNISHETTTDKDGNKETINIYEPAAKEVKTRWVDQDGNPLKKAETGKEFGQPDNFDGYELVDTRMSEDGTEKIYVYKKKATPAQPSQPQKPVVNTPQQALPKTGDAVSVLAQLVGASVGASGVVGLRGFGRRKKSK